MRRPCPSRPLRGCRCSARPGTGTTSCSASSRSRQPTLISAAPRKAGVKNLINVKCVSRKFLSRNFTKPGYSSKEKFHLVKVPLRVDDMRHEVLRHQLREGGVGESGDGRLRQHVGRPDGPHDWIKPCPGDLGKERPQSSLMLKVEMTYLIACKSIPVQRGVSPWEAI